MSKRFTNKLQEFGEARAINRALKQVQGGSVEEMSRRYENCEDIWTGQKLKNKDRENWHKIQTGLHEIDGEDDGE